MSNKPEKCELLSGLKDRAGHELCRINNKKCVGEEKCKEFIHAYFLGRLDMVIDEYEARAQRITDGEGEAMKCLDAAINRKG